MPRPPRTAAALVIALTAAVLLTGCAASTGAGDPNWKPQHSFGEANPGPTIEPVQPPHPTPSAKRDNPSGQSQAPGSSPSPGESSKADPAVVAKHLAAPIGLALLPDGTAIVGERTTGRILRVQPKPDQPVKTVRRLTGLSTAGGGGLLDLALSPNYRQDGLIFAYVTTATDNRVIAFTLTGPVTPVLTGVPRGAKDNAGRIAFGADGDLYIGTGDADKPGDAGRAGALAGKVLRVTDIGEPAAGNPTPNSPVFTSGHQAVAGLCSEPKSGEMLQAGPRAGGDVVNVLAAGGTYGWPKPSASDHPPLVTLPKADTGAGGCAVFDGVLYVTSLTGQALLAAPLSVSGSSLKVGAFRTSLVNKYGRLRTVVAAPDGALWLTTSNRDGHGSPVPDDERVLRIMPAGGGGSGSPV